MPHYNLKNITSDLDRRVLRAIFDARRDKYITNEDIIRQAGCRSHAQLRSSVEHLEYLNLLSQPHKDIFTVSDWLYEDNRK